MSSRRRLVLSGSASPGNDELHAIDFAHTLSRLSATIKKMMRKIRNFVLRDRHSNERSLSGIGRPDRDLQGLTKAALRPARPFEVQQRAHSGAGAGPSDAGCASDPGSILLRLNVSAIPVGWSGVQ
jgi:hypothetical protein